MSIVELRDQGGGLVVPWPRFIGDFRQAWRKDQHLTVVGMNGSGKSWLERWLLEECRSQDRVFLIDLKASDEILRLGFRTAHEMPGWWGKQLSRLQQRREGRQWIRIVPPTRRAEARRVVNAYMQLAYHAARRPSSSTSSEGLPDGHPTSGSASSPTCCGNVDEPDASP